MWFLILNAPMVLQDEQDDISGMTKKLDTLTYPASLLSIVKKGTI
jgi:hypothetical protein